MAKKPHTRCSRGKRVELVLHDGGRVAGKFRESTDRHIFLSCGAKVAVRDVKAFMIMKRDSGPRGAV